ncbi:sigma-70 family RNA polymerase sigma factor [Chitinophaga sp. Cy-1792]|uniref:sigma-70 family RNA polymerase sigma factor n=1 Tax=Chitinophaga sp. Cy-1792 TaxID=2608339 RepID=UPI00142399EF|nr:sigma-70 family RNA polymerase sigma factor [Chitinophaga sp. Cy-1792]NIG55489.1 sigma-70 family RNA polymerase sigma factor [Chitinophaga sp. Cy-1792]
MLRKWQEHIAIHNDTEAFKALYLHLMPGLSRFATAFLRDASIAENITADILAGVWNNRHTLLEIDNLKVHLYMIIRNACMHYLELRDKVSFCAFETMQVTPAMLSTGPGNYQKRMKAEIQAVLNQAVRGLSSKSKLIFVLAREEQFRHEEIAVILNISTRTVDYELALITEQLHHCIMPYLVK